MNTMRRALGVVLGMALVLGAPVGGCEGNVNDDSVLVLDIDLVSRSYSGGPADASARYPHMSADGRVVVFESRASNIDPMDPNTVSDVFVRDMETGFTRLVSVNNAGTGPGNGDSYRPRISPDGRFVAFTSYASNIAPSGFDSNNVSDVFVRDLLTGVTVPVSVNVSESATANNGSYNKPDVTCNGTYVFVVFDTYSSDVVADPSSGSRNQIYLRRIPVSTFSSITSGDTIMVSTNGAGDIAGDGNSQGPVVAMGDGNVCVAWYSAATNLNTSDTGPGEDVYYRRYTVGQAPVDGSAILVSVRSGGAGPGNGDSQSPAISGDGRFVAFETEATDLLPTLTDLNGCRDIYMRGPMYGGAAQTIRVSVNSDGTQALSDCEYPSVSYDGRFVTFSSIAPNLVGDDTNGADDVFLRDMVNSTTVRVSMTIFAGETSGDSDSAVVSWDGTIVVFDSSAPNIMPGLAFSSTQVYRRRY